MFIEFLRRAAANKMLTFCLPQRGILGFAQKTSIKKAGDASGKICLAFLGGQDAFKWLLGAMMSDGGNETMQLIREFDEEEMDTTRLSSLVERYLDHIVWMYFQNGVYEINGHTAFIIEWFESKPHHFKCGHESKCIGGCRIDAATHAKALHHMQCWTHLVKHCLEAEFPSFSLISTFSVFQLPQKVPKTILTPAAEQKVKRLGVIFKQAHLVHQFKHVWHHALLAYKASNFTIDYWDAWMRGSEKVPARDCLEHVVLRGQTFAPVTSKIEQNFAKIDERLGQHRLHASGAVENLYVNLLLADLNDKELDDVVNRAISVWREAFGCNARQHIECRLDKGIPNKSVERVLPAGSKVPEKTFLKRISEVVAQKATPGSSSILDSDATRPPVWAANHEVELTFQKNKRRKREVEACLQGHLVQEEVDDALKAASVKEKIRQEHSYADRLRARLKYADKVRAVPPTRAELLKAKIFLDDGVNMPQAWLAMLTSIQGMLTREAHLATFFISNVPGAPENMIVTLAAALRGAWVISPAVFMAEAGPSIKYTSALTTKRRIWSSPAFQQEFPMEWLVILELMSNCAGKWSFLASAEAWAAARAYAERQKRSAEVFALVATAEMRPTLKHSFNPSGLVAFVAHTDPEKGSIGLLGM